MLSPEAIYILVWDAAKFEARQGESRDEVRNHQLKVYFPFIIKGFICEQSHADIYIFSLKLFQMFEGKFDFG